MGHIPPWHRESQGVSAGRMFIVDQSVLNKSSRLMHELQKKRKAK
jgi:hypothetical protein